ncbi:hypothetical protein ABW18_20425 [Gordonia jacobaea]|uniref:Polysaccharide chain length determinant N-terminal domain-containing protein n=1 Tax=Gordonia jacobaea TaxID=122202 RepID=A0ABR5I7L2_9ACTN|nr:hypothetical protein ABW18_20425 [Gordonia jacobaea]
MQRWARSVLRYWWWIALFSLAGGIVGLGIGMIQTPTYSATATVYVTSGSDANSQSAYQGSLASQQRVTSYTRLATSDAIVSSALARIGSPLSVEDAQRDLEATATPATVLMSITARNPNPEIAASLANGVASALADYVRDLEKPSDGGDALAKVTLVSPATVPSAPVSLKSWQFCGLGILAGGLLGLFVCWVRDLFDSRVRSAAEVEAIVGAATVAELPFDAELDGTGVANLAEGGNLLAEACRKLRSNLAFIGVDSPLRTIVVSSGSAGEGKTTVSVGLALSLVEAGFSVVVVDADLRRPRVARVLGVNGAIGLTTYLRGDVSLADALQATDFAGLSVMSAGEIPPNPSEMLGSEAAESCIADLQREFDFVILDSAPLLPVSDSLVLAHRTDGLLLVVRSGVTTSHALERVVKTLNVANLSVLGTVMNSVEASSGYYDKYSQDTSDSSGRSSLSSRD